MFYHSEKLQSTKTKWNVLHISYQFYHSEKLQSTKTANEANEGFIIAKNYRVLKPEVLFIGIQKCFIIAKNYRVLKRPITVTFKTGRFIIAKNYRVLKLRTILE